MVEVKLQPGESFESLLKRFIKKVDKSGIMSDLRKHEAYEKPGAKAKKKRAAARKKALKRMKRQENKVKTGQNFRFNADRTKKIYTAPRNKYNKPRSSRHE